MEHNDTSADLGFETIEAFNAAIVRLTVACGYEGQRVSVTQLNTPIGPLLAGASDTGLCLLEYMDPKRLERQLHRLQKHLNAEITPGNHPIFPKLQTQLNAYFNRTLQAFDIPLALCGTHFQTAVWNALLQIPYGETRSYTDQAKSIGMLEALRAVARANGENRIAILIPCHRVIGKNGALTGYGGGLWRKEFLLHLEGAPEQLTLDGMG